jgi:hypothetical protein
MYSLHSSRETNVLLPGNEAGRHKHNWTWVSLSQAYCAYKDSWIHKSILLQQRKEWLVVLWATKSWATTLRKLKIDWVCYNLLTQVYRFSPLHPSLGPFSKEAFQAWFYEDFKETPAPPLSPPSLMGVMLYAFS